MLHKWLFIKKIFSWMSKGIFGSLPVLLWVLFYLANDDIKRIYYCAVGDTVAIRLARALKSGKLSEKHDEILLGNLRMNWHLLQVEEVVILRVTSCHRNRDKFPQLDESRGSIADLTFSLKVTSYDEMYNRLNYTRVLIGLYSWSISGKTHRWRHQ